MTTRGTTPRDWRVILLDSVARRGSGHTPSKAHPEYWGGDIKWISLQDSHRLDRLYISDTDAKITPAGIANSSAKVLPSGTVVLSRDAGVGKSAIMRCDMAVSQHFMAWTCGPLLNNHYLYYRLQFCKPEFERIAMGNTIKTIGLPYFRQFSIPLPPHSEQQAIAEALSDADALMESLELLIAKKRQIKQGAMQELLIGKRRLPGFAEEWKVRRVGELLSIVHGRSQEGVQDPNGLYPILATGGRIGTARSYLHAGPSVLIGRKGTIDRPQYMDSPFWTIDTLFYSVVHDPNVAKFIYYRFCLVPWRLYNEASGVPSLNAGTIEEIEFLVPDHAEQFAISTRLSDMDAEIDALEAKLTKTRQLKSAMMHDLLTGRIRLV